MIEEVDFSAFDFNTISTMTFYPNGDFKIVSPAGDEGFYNYSGTDYSLEQDEHDSLDEDGLFHLDTAG